MDGSYDEPICEQYWSSTFPNEALVFKFIAGFILCVILLFITKTKNVQCCCGCWGTPVSVKFLEDKDNRLMIITIFTIASKNIFELLIIDLNSDTPEEETEKFGPYERQFIKLASVQAFGVAFLPLLVASTTSGQIFHFIIGLFYTSLMIIYEIAINFPLCDPLLKTPVIIIYIAKWIFKIKPERLDKILKKTISWSEMINLQVDLVYGCFLTSITLALLIILVTVLHMMKSYRKNVLDMSRQLKNKYVLNLKEINLSNVNIIVNALQFSGYQTAHIIWGFIIHLLVLFLVSFIIGEIIIVPLTISFVDFFLALLDYFGPILMVILLTLIIQWMLVRFFFIQDKGKVLALDNRRNFYNLMYFMYFYNLLTGILTCFIRILKSIVFSVLTVPRLDQSIFPSTYERFDSGFKAYSCLLKMEALQSNSIVVVFVAIVNKKIKAKKQMESQKPSSTGSYILQQKLIRDYNRRQRKLIAIHRWFLAWTLIHNEALVYERVKKFKQVRIKY
uniref:Uncharacterized protein n=1 Tax=Strigamia maritima TaxID=126957 RepID=T1IMT4_STRMM